MLQSDPGAAEIDVGSSGCGVDVGAKQWDTVLPGSGIYSVLQSVKPGTEAFFQ